MCVTPPKSVGSVGTIACPASADHGCSTPSGRARRTRDRQRGKARKPLWGLGFVRFRNVPIPRNALWTREIVVPVGGVDADSPMNSMVNARWTVIAVLQGPK